MTETADTQARDWTEDSLDCLARYMSNPNFKISDAAWKICSQADDMRTFATRATDWFALHGIEPIMCKDAGKIAAMTAERAADQERILALEAERADIPGKLLPAYLGLMVLRTMLRKVGLEGGVEASDNAMACLCEIETALPALSALRTSAPITNAVGGT